MYAKKVHSLGFVPSIASCMPPPLLFIMAFHFFFLNFCVIFWLFAKIPLIGPSKHEEKQVQGKSPTSMCCAPAFA